jgi:hypothetical protein
MTSLHIDDDRQHRQRCAEWFAQMYGNELDDVFGREPQNHTENEQERDADDE